MILDIDEKKCKPLAMWLFSTLYIYIYKCICIYYMILYVYPKNHTNIQVGTVISRFTLAASLHVFTPRSDREEQHGQQPGSMTQQGHCSQTHRVDVDGDL